jgi:uncharacterized membrane protein
MGAMTWVSGAGLGAGLMYFLDPERGRRRRALSADKTKRLATVVGRGVEKTKRDLANRGRGIAAVTAAHIPFQSRRAKDYVLDSRVRSGLGRWVSHPHAIDVAARGGVVTLSGDVLAEEAAGLLAAVSRVAGVDHVESRLHRHEKADDFPTLQGNGHRPQPRFELLQANWSPAARTLTGGAGCALAMYGLWKGGVRGAAAGIAGAGLLARSLTNMEFKELVGVRHGSRGIHIQKTIHIAAPVEKVYEFWANYENFPRFMRHLKEVRETGPGRSHWIASGPGGVAVEWDAEITEVTPMRVLAWSGVPGSAVENTGNVRFDSNAHNGTRLTIQLSYQPPAGAMGHALAKLFGSDPKRAMDEDLVRLKSLLEVGKTRLHGEVITQSKLSGVAKTLVPASSAGAGIAH